MKVCKACGKKFESKIDIPFCAGCICRKDDAKKNKRRYFNYKTLFNIFAWIDRR